jgi:hypothetical protein
MSCACGIFLFALRDTNIPQFALKIRILVMMPLMVMSPSSTKLVLIFSFDFGLIGLELPLVEI